MSHRTFSAPRRHSLQALACFGSLVGMNALAQSSAAGSAVTPGGVAATRVLDEVWLDATRQRQLPVLQRWPARPNGAWIVYSHGLGGSREGGDAWGQAWSEAGFAVFHLQHPGSDISLWPQGVGAVRQAANADQLFARVADVRFAIDEVQRRIGTRGEKVGEPGDPPFGFLKAARVGVAGHSFGARSTQVVAGERSPTGAGFADERARAFIAFSPSAGRAGAMGPAVAPASAYASARARFAGVTRPFLCLTGTQDGDPLSGDPSGEPRRQVYEALPAGARAELWLDGADHNTFGGNLRQRITARSGLLRREPVALERETQHQALLAQVSTLWWSSHLLEDVGAAQALRPPRGLAGGDAWRSG